MNGSTIEEYKGYFIKITLRKDAVFVNHSTGMLCWYPIKEPKRLAQAIEGIKEMIDERVK